MRKSYFYYALLLTVFCLLGTVGFAQDKMKNKEEKEKSYKEYEHEFCSNDNWSNGDKVSVKDLRESTIAGGDVKVNSKNGRITVLGENRTDVLVRACVNAWADTKEKAKSLVDSIRVNTSSEITADIPENSNTSVSYEIHVPKSTNLDLSANNGRITISDVQGQIKFKTQNGRITLSEVSGDVQGLTQNGRVTVKLSGNSWRGNGLDVKANNGRIELYMPSNYAANVDVGTGNGRFSSSFDELQVSGKTRKETRYGSNKVNANLNGGGATIRVVTGNGRVSIHSN